MSEDPMVHVAWAERPTGPLSNLYLTSEQMNTVHDWLADVIARVRRDERKHPLSVWHDGYSVGYEDALDAAQEAVERVRHWDGFDEMTGETYRATDKDFTLAAIDALKEETK